MANKKFREDLSKILGFYVGEDYDLSTAIRSMETSGKLDQSLLIRLVLFLLDRTEKLESKM